MKKLLLTSFLFALACGAGAQIITTIAGTGVNGYMGDYGPAKNAELRNPGAVVLDRHNDLLFADANNNVIRMIDSLGIITTIAGNGSPIYNGDSIGALDAGMTPSGIAFDRYGNIFFADFGNNRIRKIDTLGILTTIAGIGGIGGFSGDSSLAINAMLSGPAYVAIDTFGIIYFTDGANHRVRAIDTSGIITTIVGTGVAGFSGDNGPARMAMIDAPLGIVADASGTIYFCDNGNNRIRKFNPRGGDTIYTIAGNGTAGYNGDNITATSAEIYAPSAITIDSVGNIFFADGNNNRIRKISTSGTITTIAGNGMDGCAGDNGDPLFAEFSQPNSAAIDKWGNIYIGDGYNHRIRFIRYNVAVTNVSGNGGTISIYPNPSLGYFTLLASSAINEQDQITVTDILGIKVMEIIEMTNTPVNIQLSVPDGIYYILAITAHETFSGQVSIVR